MSDRPVNFTVGADTSEAKKAFEELARQANSSFESMTRSMEESGRGIGRTLTSLREQITQLQAMLANNISEASFRSLAPILVQLQQEFVKLGQAAGFGLNLAGDAAGVMHRSFTESLSTVMGWNREIISASSSAAVFANSLRNVGVSTSEARMLLEQMQAEAAGLTGRLANAAVSFNTLAEAEYRSAAALRANIGLVEQSSAVFGAYISHLNTVNLANKSAAESASVFSAALGTVGDRVRTVASKELQPLINNMRGTDTQTKSAAASAMVFARNGMLPLAETSAAARQHIANLGVATANADTAFRAASPSARQFGDAVSHAGGMSTLAAREITVIAREALTGQFSRVPGSVMVLARTFGELTMAMTAGIVGFGALGFAAMELIRHLHDLRQAAIASQASFAIGNPAVTRQQVEEFRSQLSRMSEVTTEQSGKILAEFGKISGAHTTLIQFLINNIQNYAAATGQGMEQAAASMARAFSEPTAHGEQFLRDIRAGSQAILDFQKAANSTDPGRFVAMRSILATALDTVYKKTEQITESSRTATSAWQSFMMRMAGAATSLSAAESGMSGTAATMTEQFAPGAAIAAQRAQGLANALQNLNNVNDEGGKGSAQQMQVFQSQLQERLREVEEESLQESRTIQQANLAKYDAEAEFWRKTRDALEEGSAIRREVNLRMLRAEREVADERVRIANSTEELTALRIQLQAKLLEVEKANVGHVKTMNELHTILLKAEVDFWQQVLGTVSNAGKLYDAILLQLGRARLQLQTSEIRGTIGAGRDIIATKRAEAREEQELARGKFEEIMAIEQRLLNFIRQLKGEKSREYLRELLYEEQLERRHAEEVSRIVHNRLERERQEHDAALAERRADLQAEVAAHNLTNSEALLSLRSFMSEQHRMELEHFDDYIKTLREGTEIYNKELDNRKSMAARFFSEEQKLSADAARAEAADRNRLVQSYLSEFNTISSAWNSVISGFINRSMTWRQAELKLLASVVESFINMLSTMLARWVLFQTAKTLINNVNLTKQVAAEQAAGNSGLAAFGKWIAQKLGLMTAETTAEAGIRQVGVAAEAAAEGEKMAIKAAGAASGLAVDSAVATADIGMSAARGGAAAAASEAAIPIIGPAAAPGVGAALMALILGFKSLLPSFAVGSWDVPSDMVANIHKGEMIIPARAAAGIRGMSSMGQFHDARAMHSTLNYSPSLTQHGGTDKSFSGRDARAFFTSHGRQLLQFMQQAQRDGRTRTWARPGKYGGIV